MPLYQLTLVLAFLLLGVGTVLGDDTEHICLGEQISGAEPASVLQCRPWVSTPVSISPAVVATGRLGPSSTMAMAPPAPTTPPAGPTLYDTSTPGSSTIIDTVLVPPGSIPTRFGPRPTPTPSNFPPTPSNEPGKETTHAHPKTIDAKCYYLPYGFFGFIAHAVFLYSTAMVAIARRPTAPFQHHILGHLLYNVGIAVIHLVGLASITAVHMIKCSKNSVSPWRFRALGFWTIIETGVYMTILVDRLLIRRRENARRLPSQPDSRSPLKKPFLWFTIPHALGAIPSFVALIFLLRGVWDEHYLAFILITSLSFGLIAVGLFIFCMGNAKRLFNFPYPYDTVGEYLIISTSGFFLLFMVFAVSTLLYSDIALQMVLRPQEQDYKAQIAYGMAFVCWILPILHY